MSEFKREERYIVLKLKHLTDADIEQIHFTLNRYNWSRALTECVVVESDWPIYEEVWDMVQRLAEGREQKSDQLKASNKELLEALEYSCEYLDENKLNSIGSGSKAHMEMREAITNAKQVME